MLLGAAAVLLTLALWSYDLHGGDDWVGPAGAALAGWLLDAFGLTACVLPLELGLGAAACLSRQQPRWSALARMASLPPIALVASAMLHMLLRDEAVFGGHLPGGTLGELLGEVLVATLGPAGSKIVSATILLATLVLRTRWSLIGAAASVRRGVQWAALWLRAGAQRLWLAWQQAKELEARLDEPELETLDAIHARHDRDAQVAAQQDLPAADEPGAQPDENEQVAEALPPPRKARPSSDAGKRATTPASSAKRPQRSQGPVIVAPREQSLSAAAAAAAVPAGNGCLLLPPPSLLAPPEQRAGIDVDEATLRANAERLVEKLAAYGVRGRVDEIHPGPVVTMYEFEPASGTKVSKIAGLADDLAMALAAQKVRIVAPIPGKSRVGFELPNRKRQNVWLREILEDARWLRMRGALPLAFGKDISGQPVFGDLTKMPHLLVAGATGSGKSVGLNVMLLSLLLKKRPDEVRLLMIDPKVVELNVFQDIPHMLLPVVTDMKKASLALKWAVDEMERRYQLFADAGARSILTYNERVEKVERGELDPSRLTGRRAADDDGEPETPEKLPHIVVVVDEFADLMMVAAKDVEAAIARLAQKARAAGIHVILATQRPSVDVITGMIKANFPSRVGYKVSQREDSKTILGRQGAEHLLGMGDMLMLLPGCSDLKRVHSAYVSEEEVSRVCDFLREQGRPIYNDDILRPRDDDEDADYPSAGSDDPLYDRGVRLVAEAGYCSISHLQRNLGVGYNKAAKLVERMEKEGVVGPASSKAGGRREVLIEAH